jgi:hypothetical protein
MSVPFSPRPAPDAGSGSVLGLEVSPENVLQVSAAVRHEARRLLTARGTVGAAVGQCGADPVSADAAVAFDGRITELSTECRRYVSGLFDAADALLRVARSYGYTEEQIRTAFDRTP